MFRPCLRSGYCCKQRPCPYGEVTSPSNPSCRHLQRDESGRYECGIYDQIVRQPGSEISPAFGAGCCSPMNSDRQDLVEKRSTIHNILG